MGKWGKDRDDVQEDRMDYQMLWSHSIPSSWKPSLPAAAETVAWSGVVRSLCLELGCLGLNPSATTYWLWFPGQVPNLLEPQFIHLENGGNKNKSIIAEFCED